MFLPEQPLFLNVKDLNCNIHLLLDMFGFPGRPFQQILVDSLLLVFGKKRTCSTVVPPMTFDSTHQMDTQTLVSSPRGPLEARRKETEHRTGPFGLVSVMSELNTSGSSCYWDQSISKHGLP